MVNIVNILFQFRARMGFNILYFFKSFTLNKRPIKIYSRFLEIYKTSLLLYLLVKSSRIDVKRNEGFLVELPLISIELELVFIKYILRSKARVLVNMSTFVKYFSTLFWPFSSIHLNFVGICKPFKSFNKITHFNLQPKDSKEHPLQP